ncbi:hypothetical protein HMPREF9094_0113, partial [Fusobacterium animalis ATCC 51191]
YKREIAKKVIKEYGDSKKIVEILACYLNFFNKLWFCKQFKKKYRKW